MILTRRLAPVFLFTLALFISSAVAASAATQALSLSPGFNFVSFTAIDPAATSQTFMQANASVNGVYRFNQTTKKYESQLNLGGGDFDGTAFAFEAGRGYILRATVAATVSMTGTAQANASQPLVAGFAIVGFLDTGKTSRTFMQETAGIVGVYRFDPVAKKYVSDLNLGGGEFDGVPFDLTPGTGYVVRVTSSFAFNTAAPAGTAPTITLSPGATTLSAAKTQVFAATLANVADTASTLLWKVDGVAGGTASTTGTIVSQGAASALYTAPSAIPAAKSVSVTAELASNAAVSATAAVSLAADPPAAQVSGVTHLTSTGNATVTIPAFASTERLVVIPFAKTSTFKTGGYAYGASSASVSAPRDPGARAPASSPASFSAAPPSAQGYVDVRQRAMDSHTARAAGSTPPGAPSTAPARAPARALAVGAQQTFFSLNSTNYPPSAADWTTVTATLKVVGTHCYVFEDNTEQVKSTRIPDAGYTELANGFDNEVYAVDTATFGAEPRPPSDIDGEDRVFILFTDNVNKQGAAGYFDSANQLTNAEISTISSPGVFKTNQKEMFYMQVASSTNKWGTNLKERLLGVLAHEFFHMIVWNQHVKVKKQIDSEEPWLNEGLAQVAQDVVGYGQNKGFLSFVMEPYLNSPGTYSLTNFTFSTAQYGASYLFARYLADTGVSLSAITQTDKLGIANVEAVTGKTFATVFANWAATVYLSNTTIVPGNTYKYTTINLRAAQPDGTSFNGPALSKTTTLPLSYNGSVQPWGVNFIQINGGSGGSVSVTLTDTGNSGLGVSVIRGTP